MRSGQPLRSAHAGVGRDVPAGGGRGRPSRRFVHLLEGSAHAGCGGDNSGVGLCCRVLAAGVVGGGEGEEGGEEEEEEGGDDREGEEVVHGGGGGGLDGECSVVSALGKVA